MTPREEIYQAIRNADKAGDSEAVKKLAAYLQTMPPDSPKVDPSEGGGTLQFGPIDTGIPIPQAINRALIGAGKAFADIGTGVQQLGAGVADVVAPRQQKLSDLVTGRKPVSRVDELRAQVADQRKLDAPLMDTTAGKVGNVLGNLALFAPTAMIPGANTVTGGAALGAISGLLQPSTSTQETLTNTGVGGVAGAAVPLAVKGVRTLKAAAEPFYERGRQAIVGRALNAAAGQDAPQVAQRLATAQELVPGSAPTVGQAAENPGIAALERAATATNPEVTNAVASRMQQQNAARVGALQDMAGTQGARSLAEANREAAAQALYGKAYGQPLPKLSAQQEATVADLMKRPALKAAIEDAKTLALNEGVDITAQGGSVKGLDYVKRALDDQISQAAGNQKRVLMGVKEKLVGLLDELSPEYASARQTFAQQSRPINQMDVAQEILDKSVDKLTGNLRPSSYARALTDNTAEAATGMRGATLGGTMEPQQMNMLQAILQDAQRANAAQTAGRGVGSDTVQKLAYTNMLDQAGVPSFMRSFAPTQFVGNVAGRVADAAYGRANRELSNKLAEVMLDPKTAAAFMKQATPAERNALIEMAKRTAATSALALPAAANANKE